MEANGVDLITGGAGFIGSRIVRQLRAAGRQVVVYDNLVLHHSEPVDVDSAAVVRGDIRDYEKLRSLFYRWAPERVFHLASNTDLNLSEEDPVLDTAVTVGGTAGLLHLAKKHKVKRFVFSSTSGVYGGHATQPLPTPESFLQIRPTNTYQANKRSAEIHVELAHQEYKLSTAILRFAQIYGPGKDSVCTRFVCGVEDGSTIKIHLDGSTTCDLVYVDDCAAAVIAVANSTTCGTFNVGSSYELSLKQLLEFTEKAVGKKAARVESVDLNDRQPRLFLDDTALREQFGWKPTVTIESGLTKIVDWLRVARSTGKTKLFREGCFN